MNSYLVSIIIPTYNRAHLIGETLDSVLAQSYANWECIVVDDGSTDDTEVIVQGYVKKDSCFQYHKRPDTMPKGGNSCRNYGFLQSKGAYLVFLDSDDLLIPEALRERILIAEGSQADILISATGVFNSKIGDTDKVWNVMAEDTTVMDFLVRFFNVDMPWQTAGLTWSRSFYEICGGWHPTLLAWQDWELHCRALIKQPQIAMVDRVDNYYRFLTPEGVATSYRDKTYLKAMALAIISIYRLLLLDTALYKQLKCYFEVLLFAMLIKRPVLLGYFGFPLHYLFKIPFWKGGLSRFKFIKIYVVELLSRSTKIRKYVLGDYYKKQTRYLTLQTSHLK